MASYASKVRSNQAFKAAAKALDLRPKHVKTQQAFARVKAYAAKQEKPALPTGGGGNTPIAGGSSASPAGDSFDYSPATVGGNSFATGVGLYGSLGKAFPGNEIVGGEVVGGLINAAGGLINIGLADQYTRNTLSALGEYNSGEDIRKTGHTKDLMSTEAALTGDLYRVQGDQARKGYVTQGEQERLNIGATGEQQRLNFQEQGRQERETLGQKTLEERKLRADARGAIRSQGARFYA